MKDAGLVAQMRLEPSTVRLSLRTQARPAEGNMVVDVSAIEIADNDEVYKISLQGSNSATFASGIVDLAILSWAPWKSSAAI